MRESRKEELQLKALTLETASQLQEISERLEEAVKEDNFTAVCEAVRDIPNAYEGLAASVQVVEEAIEEAGE